jgi:hypothetical protein
MATLKNPSFEGGNEVAYQFFISQVAEKVHELEMEYEKLSEKLPAKLDDIFEPIIKIKIGTNEIVALCDLGVSVFTIPIFFLKILVHACLLNLSYIRCAYISTLPPMCYRWRWCTGDSQFCSTVIRFLLVVNPRSQNFHYLVSYSSKLSKNH